MDDDRIVKSFRLALMSPQILAITTVLLVLPLALFLGALFGGRFLAVPALFVVGIYVWVWLRFRPRRFVVHERSMEVIWPMKRRSIPRADISSVRLLDRAELRQEIGSGLRVGAGGLWGGFGWLWTKRRGIVQMYVSRNDIFVWIERKNGRPWLITPEQPENFVRALLSQ
ncbi:MAG: PH domain-containing protein [Nitrospiraceae bacterium]